MTEDLCLAHKIRWMSRRSECDTQSSIFGQPTISQITVHQLAEGEGHAGTEQLSWQPERSQTERSNPVFEAPGKKVHSLVGRRILGREHEIERLRRAPVPHGVP